MSAPVIVVTFTDDDGDEFPVSVPAWRGRDRRDVLKEARDILAQTIEAGGFLVEGHCRVSGFNGVWEDNAWIAASVEDLAPAPLGRTDASHFFGVHVSDYSREGVLRMRAELAKLSDGRELDVMRMHSGSEDGYLWYATRAGAKIGDGGWMHEADALREALSLVLEEADADRIASARIAFEEANPAARDRRLERIRIYGRVPSDDVIAARIAKDAADTFEYDQDREDDTSCAMRAADILRDLAPEDRAAFLLRIFGTPNEERHATRELEGLRRAQEYGREHPYAGACGEDDAREDRIREIREEARRELGYPDVARVILFEARDVLEPIAFDGHEAFTDANGREFGESTNLHAYREARAAFDRVQDVRAHTFGGCSLDGYAHLLDKLGDVAIGAAIEAVSYAAWNASQDLSEGYETGMPRPE